MRYGLNISLRERTKAWLLEALKTADDKLRRAIMNELALRKSRMAK